MASAAMSLQQRLVQFQQQQQMAKQQQQQQQQPPPTSATLPQSSAQPFSSYLYRQQREQQQQGMQGAPSSQPASSMAQGISQAPTYSSGGSGQQLGVPGSPQVPKPGHLSWGEPALRGLPAQPGAKPVSAGALQQVGCTQRNRNLLFGIARTY